MPRSARPRARRRVRREAVNQELLPWQTPAFLDALGLLRRDGGLNADALRKLKQINHFLGLVGPSLERTLQGGADPLWVDVGAGNAYLTLALSARWLHGPDATGRGALVGVDVREDVLGRARARAEALGHDRLGFRQLAAAELARSGALREGEKRPRYAGLDDRHVDAVVALHACDTATDDALVLGVEGGASVVALVPCCQAEVARLLADAGPGPLWRHRLHRREFGAHLTNAMRALVLEAHGYKVTVTELVGWEHSLKAELILGWRVGRYHRGAQANLAALCAAHPVLAETSLMRRLGGPDPRADNQPASSPDPAAPPG